MVLNTGEDGYGLADYQLIYGEKFSSPDGGKIAC
jgi:hypothetical protein